jgi:hypothetical protein
VADAHDIREAIRGLRAEINELKREPACGDHWRAWFHRTCGFLREAYGSGSPQLAGFLEIHFELGGPTQEAQQRIEESLPQFSVLHISTDRYYIERLSEADEYLLSLIVPP